MFIKFYGCESTNNGCIKVRRNEFKNEPKKNTMVQWLSSGFSYQGMVIHKDIEFVYIKILG